MLDRILEEQRAPFAMASSPTYESRWPAPTMTPFCFGRPTTLGKMTLGASSSAKPALIRPVPLSMTMGLPDSYSSPSDSSSAMPVGEDAAAHSSASTQQRRESEIICQQSKAMK